jgi:hypothetical protein
MFLFLSESHPRFICLVTFLAQHGAPNFRLKRNAVVPAAMIADNFKTRRGVFAQSGFFRAASLAALRLRHISLIKNFLVFFGKKKNLFTLNARNLKVGHCQFPPTK